MENFENPDHPGNSEVHHTGRFCIEPRCVKPAGTAWSPLWCVEHNVERMRKINKGFADLERAFSATGES